MEHHGERNGSYKRRLWKLRRRRGRAIMFYSVTHPEVVLPLHAAGWSFGGRGFLDIIGTQVR
jgi:hypothetical protein